MKKSFFVFSFLVFLAIINPVMAECVVQPKGCTQVLDNEEVYVKFWSLQDCLDIMGVEYADYCIIAERPTGVDNGEIIEKITPVHHASSKKGISEKPASGCRFSAGDVFYSFDIQYSLAPIRYIVSECLNNPDSDHIKSKCLNTLNFDYDVNDQIVSCKLVERQPGDCPYYPSQILGDVSFTDETEFNAAMSDNFESVCRAKFIDSNWNNKCEEKYKLSANPWMRVTDDGTFTFMEGGGNCEVVYLYQ